MISCEIYITTPYHTPHSFFFNDTATTEIYTLSLHDALPIWILLEVAHGCSFSTAANSVTSRSASASSKTSGRSEEHTSELQSRRDLVCRLLLEKKKENAIEIGNGIVAFGRPYIL